ncbi:MAG: hypothetical protein AAF432_02305 [Planctomycetota bacterium]
MKAAASVLIMVALVVGVIAGPTAYVPKLDNVADADPPFTLNAPSGAMENEEGDTVPVLDPGAAEGDILLTPDNVEVLRAAGVERVRVKEFSFENWDYKFVFIISAIGLILGAMMLRVDARKHIAAQTAAMGEGGTSKSPKQLLNEAHDRVKLLLEKVRTESNDELQSTMIIAELDDIRHEYFDPFVEARPVLIGSYGISGFAQIMDRFAGAERQLNRAWSAAADLALHESLPCLEEGIRRLEIAVERLDA